MPLFRLSKFISVLVLAIFAIGGYTPQVQAASGVTWPNVRLTSSAASATANGTAAITVTASFYIYECNDGSTSGTTTTCDEYGGGVKGEKPYTSGCPNSDTIVVSLSVAGDGAVLSKTSVCGGASGTDTFTVKSSVAGTKTITPVASWSYSAATKNGTPVSLSFVAPTATPAPKPKAVATPAPAPAPVVEKPAAPTVATITAGNEEVKSDQPVSITTAEPLVLKGKTVPNGKVAVYVFSDPKLFETAADAEGNWSVTVEGLPEGNHHAEVEVTNPANNQKSERAKFLEFSVVAATTQKATSTLATASKAGSKMGLWVGSGLLVVLVAGGTGFWFWKRKQRRTPTPESPASVDEQTDSDSSSGSPRP